jgi:hypothetical protein
VKRVLALVLAAGLVVGAVFVRRAIDHHGGSGAGGVPQVVCASEVQAACLRLASSGLIHVARIEDPGQTTDRLSTADGTLGADAWLVSGFWPQIVTGNRARAGLPPLDLTSSAVLGTQPARVFLRPARAKTTIAHCSPLEWKCLAPMAAQPWTSFGGQPDWGQVSLALPPIDTTAGLVTVADAVGSAAGSDHYASNDIVDQVDEFMQRLARDATTMTDPVDSMVVQPGSVDITAGLKADSNGQPNGSVTTVWAAPAATVGAVIAGPTGGLDLGAVRHALELTGWDAPTDTSQITTGLPRPDVMDAVRAEWKQGHP